MVCWLSKKKENYSLTIIFQETYHYIDCGNMCGTSLKLVSNNILERESIIEPFLEWFGHLLHDIWFENQLRAA
jgi:hypothetical protein